MQMTSLPHFVHLSDLICGGVVDEGLFDSYPSSDFLFPASHDHQLFPGAQGEIIQCFIAVLAELLRQAHLLTFVYQC